MIKAIILSILATLLVAQNEPGAFKEQRLSFKNPQVYAALGDVIYDNVEKIEKLKYIPKFSQFEGKIDAYIKEVYKAKDIAYAIEAGDKTKDKKEYLEKLRELSKTNDFFKRTTMNLFESSMLTQDNELFLQTLNSELIDTKKYKDKILEYYFAHSTEMEATGVIQKYLDEDKMLMKQQETTKKAVLTKKQIQEAKIKRIRRNDKAKQESIQKALEEEVMKKKKEIRKEQVEELTKPN
ncbi:hypothetical protein [Sulfurimonas sp.]|uniref:hypothetical protein n=1 Tax=Sulfurimonas sp. TaxID=2022749 RepID=UPI003565576A